MKKNNIFNNSFKTLTYYLDEIGDNLYAWSRIGEGSYEYSELYSEESETPRPLGYVLNLVGEFSKEDKDKIVNTAKLIEEVPFSFSYSCRPSELEAYKKTEEFSNAVEKLKKKCEAKNKEIININAEYIYSHFRYFRELVLSDDFDRSGLDKKKIFSFYLSKEALRIYLKESKPTLSEVCEIFASSRANNDEYIETLLLNFSSDEIMSCSQYFSAKEMMKCSSFFSTLSEKYQRYIVCCVTPKSLKELYFSNENVYEKNEENVTLKNELLDLALNFQVKDKKEETIKRYLANIIINSPSFLALMTDEDLEKVRHGASYKTEQILKFITKRNFDRDSVLKFASDLVLSRNPVLQAPLLSENFSVRIKGKEHGNITRENIFEIIEYGIKEGEIDVTEFSPEFTSYAGSRMTKQLFKLYCHCNFELNIEKIFNNLRRFSYQPAVYKFLSSFLTTEALIKNKIILRKSEEILERGAEYILFCISQMSDPEQLEKIPSELEIVRKVFKALPDDETELCNLILPVKTLIELNDLGAT